MPTVTPLKRLFAVVLLACIAQAPVAHATLLSLQPDTAFAQGGDTVSLNLIVGGLGNFGPESLGAFDVSVGYDTAVFAFAGYSLNSLLGDLSLFEAIDASGGDSGGAVNIAEVSLLSAGVLDALQPGEFILASLRFDVLDLAVGSTTALSILGGAVLADADGSSLPVTGATGTTITGGSSIPLPGTLLLLLGGLLCIGGAHRRRRPISRQ